MARNREVTPSIPTSRLVSEVGKTKLNVFHETLKPVLPLLILQNAKL